MRKCQGEIDMLRGITNQELTKAGLKESHLLFYQIWKELTEAKTFDTYQYKSTNILNGIQELIHNIDAYLEGIAYTTHSLNAVREELLSLFHRDIVITEEFPAIKNCFVKSLGKKPDSNSQMKGLKYQLQCYYSVLEREYDAALVHKLRLPLKIKPRIHIH